MELEIVNDTKCERVKRSKTNDTFFGDIPMRRGKKPYKNNKNCSEELKFLVDSIIKKVSVEGKYHVKS